MRPLCVFALTAAWMAAIACSTSSTGTGEPAPAATVGGAVPSPTPAAAPVSPTNNDQPGVDATSRVDSGARLIVTVGEEDIGLKNGGTVRLGHGVTAELFLDPFPPTTLSATLDVYLERDDVAVEDGFVSVAYDMMAMEHGPFGSSAKGIGGGHFLVPLDYIMFGTWDQTLTLRAGDVRSDLRIVVIARP